MLQVKSFTHNKISDIKYMCAWPPLSECEILRRRDRFWHIAQT